MIGTALRRLFLVALFAGAAFGLLDAVTHGAELRPIERAEVVALYVLFAAAAFLLASPVVALLLALLRIPLGAGRAALLLTWSALGVVLLGAWKVEAIGLIATLGGFAITSVAVASAWLRDSFAVGRAWRFRGTVGLLALAGSIVLLVRGGDEPIGAPHSESARSGGRPDVVLIVLDTTRADALGAYGAKGAKGAASPVFDQFAREGALFEQCFSSAPWTVPSHASLFTGLQPPTHGCSFEHHRWLDQRFTTLAESLAARGDYETAAFAANDYLAESNLLQGFETQVALGAGAARLALRPLLELLGWPARFCDHGAADGVRRIDRFLADRATTPRAEKPLFLFVNLLEAHWRNLPPIGERLAATRPEPGVVAATDFARQYYGPLAMAGKPIAGLDGPALRALYQAAIRYQDEQLGRLLELLRARLDLDRTVVVVTADHGENLGDGGRYDHVFALNDALLHVPLAIRYPPAFPAGARVGGLCQLVDVPPTLLELAHLVPAGPLAEESAGRTLLPSEFVPREVVLGFGDPYLGHLEAMARFTGFNRDVLPFAAIQRSLRDATHQLVRSTVRGEELFDLAADRDAVHPCGADADPIRARLAARLERELAALPGYSGPPSKPPEDPEPAPRDHRLDQIGY